MVGRVAVVGVGRMGRLHATTLAGLAEVELAAVCDLAVDATRALADELGVERVTSDYDEIVQAPEIDGVLLATPTPTHPAMTRQALEAGKHVLCEKPLSLVPGAATALGDLADELGLVLQVGFWRRYSPPWVTAHRLMAEGAIGKPVMLRLAQWDADPPPPEFCDPAISGGLAVDCGVHEFDLARWLTGREIVSVAGYTLPVVDSAIEAAGDVDNLLAVVDLGDGVRATVDLTRNARYGDDVRTEILGTEGALFVDLLPEGRTRLATVAGVETVEGSTVADATAAGVAAQAVEFVRAMDGEPTTHPGAAESEAALRAALAAQLSSELETPVNVL